jgi:hypothetical protein
MPNWYHEAIKQEAGAKENIATMLASLLLSLPMESAVAQTAKNLEIPVEQVQEVAKKNPAKRSFNDFLKVLQQTETSGYPNYGQGVPGDHGAALGPFQIHKGYWKDSGVPGKYEQCADLQYSMGVVAAYLKRYCPQALAKGDWETMAKSHHSIGGLGNDAYWAAFQRQMQKMGYSTHR